MSLSWAVAHALPAATGDSSNSNTPYHRALPDVVVRRLDRMTYWIMYPGGLMYVLKVSEVESWRVLWHGFCSLGTWNLSETCKDG